MSDKLTRAQREAVGIMDAAEKAVLADIEKQYTAAIEEIDNRIALLMGRNDANLPNVIRRVEYQQLLKEQVRAALDKLHGNAYETITSYLNDSYTDGFVGMMYNLHKQDVPMIIPIDRSTMVKAITLDTKLTDPLYTTLGMDMTKLKKTISNEITRGIASGQSYSRIANHISDLAGIPMRRAKNIARTEGGRIQEQASNDAAHKARSKGADLVKQWSAIRDGDTRDDHRMLNKQTRELDEPFEVHGQEAQHPHGFGDPAQDCNCRCTVLYVSRSKMTEAELAKMQEQAAYWGLDKTKDIEDFKKRYLKAAEPLENTGESGIIEIDELTPCLRRLSDGEIVNTTVVAISPTAKDFKDWEFDWTKPEKNGCTVHGIKVDGDNRIQGMVAYKPDPANSAVLIDIVEAAPFNNPHNKKFIKKEYAGVGGHLFAEAIKQSYEHGYNGFVYFVAKTSLIEHYEKELGAVLINPRTRTMMIDERAAKKLYDKYYQIE